MMRERLNLNMLLLSKLVWALLNASYRIIVVEGGSVALILMTRALMGLVQAIVLLLGRLCGALMLATGDEALTSSRLLGPSSL